MRILFINPNTSETFTQKIQSTATQYANAGTEIVTRTASSGPRTIECIYDEVLSAQGAVEVTLPMINSVDGIVVACYSDHPAIYALREITEKPVIGIAEASMLMACPLGHRFSIVTTNVEWEPLLWDAVRHYGLADRCASVRSTGLPVLALESAGESKTYKLIRDAAKKALEVDHAEVICLGCAGMTGLDKKLEAELHVPVIDGVVSALKLMEALIGYGIHTSKFRAYSQPKAKELVNLPKIFNSGYLGKKSKKS
jgi:allantoin racemase